MDVATLLAVTILMILAVSCVIVRTHVVPALVPVEVDPAGRARRARGRSSAR